MNCQFIGYDGGRGVKMSIPSNVQFFTNISGIARHFLRGEFEIFCMENRGRWGSGFFSQKP